MKTVKEICALLKSEIKSLKAQRKYELREKLWSCVVDTQTQLSCAEFYLDFINGKHDL